MTLSNELTPSGQDGLPNLIRQSLVETSKILGIFRAQGYLIETQVDEQKIEIPFKTEEDLERFCRFVSIYVNDAAPGNSYDGYFPSWDAKPRPVLFSPREVSIDNGRLQDMTRSICRARLMVPYNETTPSEWLKTAPTSTTEGRWCRFQFDEAILPPRLPPKELGDYVRVVEDTQYRRIDAYFITQLEDKVILFVRGLEQKSIPESLYAVPLNHVMRIRNMFKDCTSWWRDNGELVEKQLAEANEYVLQRIKGQGSLLGHLPD